MTNQSMKTAILNCKDISANIMDDIDKKLKSSKIKFTHKKKSEIIVEGSDKEKINNTIFKMKKYDVSQIKMLIQISESNGKVFIRQKFN